MNSSGPRVSVVMPTHNYGEYLKDAIESILQQTFTDLELIVVDDASTDDKTGKVLSDYAGRIQVVTRITPSNSGEAPRNDGVLQAKGEFIAVADADDTSFPSRIKKQVNYLDKNKSISIVGGGALKTDEELNPMGAPIIMPAFAQQTRYRDRLLRGKDVVIHGTVMFRREVFDTVGGYRDYASGADTEFMLRASRNYGFHNLQEKLIKYRQHRGSVSRKYGRLLGAFYKKIYLERERLWLQDEIYRAEKLKAELVKAAESKEEGETEIK